MIWVIYGVIVVVCVAVLVRAQRSHKDETQPDHYDAPTKIERHDFPELTAPTLVVVFTSQACESCRDVWNKTMVMKSEHVDIVHVEYEDAMGKKLQTKYDIQAVPTIVVCDEAGVTKKAFLGAVTATDLWAGVANARGHNAELSDNTECSH